MKILNAIHAQSIGGVDQVVRNYSEILAAEGHEVALLISDNGNDDYKITGINKIFKLKNFAQILDFLNLLFVLTKFRPDIILCHSNRIMKWMRIAKFFTKTKSIAINHGIGFRNSLHCDYIININQQICDMVIDAGFAKEKSFILPNVIKADRPYQEKKLKTVPVIGIYGRIEWRKGFDILIKACGSLAKEGINFHLKVGGFEVCEGLPLNQIKEMVKNENISDKFEFVGVVVDKKSFFQDVDIFCVPSREEPFGLVILEGFLYSTLVISSDTDGGKFLIKDGEDGLLFKNENFLSLANTIEKALNNPQDYSIFTKNAYLKMEREFGFSLLSKEMNKILLKVSNAKS